jgi:hypothetical protein
VRLVIGIGIGHAGEQVLVLFAGQQVAVVERVLAERGEQRIARFIGDDAEAAGADGARVFLLGRGNAGGRGRHGGDQRLGPGILRIQTHRRSAFCRRRAFESRAIKAQFVLRRHGAVPSPEIHV